MTYLSYYTKENNEFGFFNGILLSDDEARLLIMKAKNHFKIWKLNSKATRFRRNYGSSYYTTGERLIQLVHNPSVLLVAHELAHAMQHCIHCITTGFRWYSNEHKKFLKKILRWFNRMNQKWKMGKPTISNGV